MEYRTKKSERLNLKKDYGKSRTKQSFKDEVNVNNVIKKYRITGQMPMTMGEPMYGDFSDVKSYQESINIVMKADEQFKRLPSDIRKKFENDPAKFLEFVGNPDNHEEMVKMKLAKHKAVGDSKESPEAAKKVPESSSKKKDK